MSIEASNESDNLSRQQDEVEALSAIYGEDFKTLEEENKIYEVRIKTDVESMWYILLRFMLPVGYPSNDQPVLELDSSLLEVEDETQLLQQCQQIALENLGENFMFQLIEKLREFVEKKTKEYEELQTLQVQEQETLLKEKQDFVENLAKVMKEIDIEADPSVQDTAAHVCENVTSFEIIHGEPMTDRKSTFQAHLAVVTSREEVDKMLYELKQNRKIANATHNIMAYRILNEEKNAYIQDCDDDGENAAGSRLLHLLQIIDAKNVIIVVTRWYGGLLLGPDRFKHINNCARNLLLSCGYVDIKHPTNNQTSKSKSRLKANKYK